MINRTYPIANVAVNPALCIHDEVVIDAKNLTRQASNHNYGSVCCDNIGSLLAMLEVYPVLVITNERPFEELGKDQAIGYMAVSLIADRIIIYQACADEFFGEFTVNGFSYFMSTLSIVDFKIIFPSNLEDGMVDFLYQHPGAEPLFKKKTECPDDSDRVMILDGE